MKEDFKSFDQIIREDPLIKSFEIKDRQNKIGTLYIKSTIPSPPKWSSFFEDFIERKSIGINTSVAAALLVEIQGKIFAVTFGPGRYLLQPDSWLERFGLKVALNSIGKERIRTIDKRTFDAISRQTKEQASKETDASDFGLDIEQDLLRAVTGVPKDKKIGKKIYGMDSLSVLTDIKLDVMKGFLQKIYAKYLDDSYKRDFPWVDHISEIKDKSAIEELDTLLVSNVLTGNTDKIWMAVPEIIEWEKVGGFCFRMGQGDPEFQDVNLLDFMSSLKEHEKENFCTETFTKKHVRCINAEGYLMHSWQAYKCLYCEIEKENRTYLLSGGKWYDIDRDFVANVNQSYKEIPEYEIQLPKYNDDCEEKYCKRISTEYSNQFALMDQQMIFYGGGHSQVEFCDLYSINKDIIHIKHYGQSSLLSHLFAQGRSSGEIFQMEKVFREKVSEKLPKDFEIKNSHERPRSDDYQIVYAIISNVPGALEIPFFSKLNLKNSARSLRGLGYRVAKAKIEVDDRKTVLKKYRKKRVF